MNPDGQVDTRAHVLVFGFPRSGTTLLGRILGENPDATFVGELEALVQPNAAERTCGCRRKVADCDFWDGIVLPTSTSRDGRRDSESLSNALELLHQRYSRVVVDSSKKLRTLLHFGRTMGRDAVMIHVIRNPRGVLYSRSRVRRQRLDAGTHANPSKGRHTLLLAVTDALHWAGWNVSAAIIGRLRSDRYIRLRYEDFCGDPVRWTPELEALIGMDAEAPVAPDHTVTFTVHHSLAGNANRFEPGTVKIEEDRAYQTTRPRKGNRVGSSIRRSR